MAETFYAIIGEEQKGPYSIQDLNGLAAASTITNETLLAKPGASEWITYAELQRNLNPPARRLVGSTAIPRPGFGALSFPFIIIISAIGAVLVLTLAMAVIQSAFSGYSPGQILIPLAIFGGSVATIAWAVMILRCLWRIERFVDAIHDLARDHRKP